MSRLAGAHRVSAGAGPGPLGETARGARNRVGATSKASCFAYGRGTGGFQRISGALRSCAGRAAGKAPAGAAAVGDGWVHGGRSCSDAGLAGRHGEVAAVRGQKEISGEVAMLCDNYKEALTEAAASGTALPGSLLAHLGACAACHAFLATQQALFTFVDNGLRSRANIAMPSKFDHRIRAALQIQVSPPRRGQSWAFAFGSIAVAAAVLLAILLTQNLKQDQRAMPTSSAIKSKFAPGEQHPAVVSGDTKSLGPSPARKDQTRKSPYELQHQNDSG